MGRVKGGVTAPRGGIKVARFDAMAGGVGPPKRNPGGVDPSGTDVEVVPGEANPSERVGVGAASGILPCCAGDVCCCCPLDAFRSGGM